jgi:hypothetical protein
MKRLYFTAICIAIVLVTFALTSCRTVKFKVPEIKSEELPKDTVVIRPIILDRESKFTESDPFLLVGATLTGKILEIEVEYSGGCGGDTWTLAWTGMLMKSLPPKANIYLHLKDEDACRTQVRKKLQFDISSIYSKEVVLLLKDFRGELTYKPE